MSVEQAGFSHSNWSRAIFRSFISSIILAHQFSRSFLSPLYPNSADNVKSPHISKTDVFIPVPLVVVIFRI